MSIIITATDVTDVAPELSEETTQRLELYIDIARAFVCERFWGDQAKRVIVLYAAHLLTKYLKGMSSGEYAGPITSEKVGDLQRSYGGSGSGSSSKAGDLEGSPYGELIYLLKKTKMITPRIV